MSYPIYLGRMLSQKHGQTWATVNFGVPGECWAELWRRNYHELLSVPEAGEVCLWIGHERRVEGPLDRAVADRVRGRARPVPGARPLRLPRDAPGQARLRRAREPWKMNDAIEKLNAAYKKIAEERRLQIVDLTDMPTEHFCDGIHLTQAGNKWVAEKFLAAIEARR